MPAPESAGVIAQRADPGKVVVEQAADLIEEVVEARAVVEIPQLQRGRRLAVLGEVSLQLPVVADEDLERLGHELELDHELAIRARGHFGFKLLEVRYAGLVVHVSHGSCRSGRTNPTETRPRENRLARGYAARCVKHRPGPFYARPDGPCRLRLRAPLQDAADAADTARRAAAGERRALGR